MVKLISVLIIKKSFDIGGKEENGQMLKRMFAVWANSLNKFGWHLQQNGRMDQVMEVLKNEPSKICERHPLKIWRDLFKHHI